MAISPENAGRVAQLASWTEEGGRTVEDVAFSSDGQTLAVGVGPNVQLLQVSDRMPLRTLEGNGASVSAVAFSPDGQTLVSGSHDGTARIRRATDGMLLQVLEAGVYRPFQRANSVLDIAFSPDGHILALASYNMTVKMWRVSDWALIDTLDHFEAVQGVEFSPDGQ